jgi:RNA polymerase sigma-70 factor, ECF subfamily
MVRLAARVLGEVPEAEDVVQDAFARVWGALDNDTVTPAYASTYLYRAVTNAALDALRRRRRRSFWAGLVGDVRAHPRAEATSAAPDTHAALGEVARFVSDLPDEQRVAIVLKEVEGWTSAEIAEARGCSEGAVEQRLLRARATLRARMSEEKGS